MTKGRICKACKREIQRDILDANLSVCPFCGYYMRFHAKKRIVSLADKNSFREWDVNTKWSNPLNDDMYARKLVTTADKHKLDDAIITGEININGEHLAIGVMDSRFMMASMGHIVGERVTSLFERATKKKLPVILFCCSGGARMQEGIISLMQMEKTAAAVKLHSDAGGLYISVLTNPTMGGVTASFATLADIVLAEKGAMIGFAGARVIEQNTGKKLPNGFQTAEFQKEHGFVDMIIERADLRDTLSYFLKLHQKKTSLHSGEKKVPEVYVNKRLAQKTAWERVMIARSMNRPTSKDYIDQLFQKFTELSGDRISSDDRAIVGGVAYFRGCPVTVIGHQKGKGSVEAALYRNWGMPLPQGYRKVMRLAKQAEKFHRPIIFFIDTIGAACGQEAEERGQGVVIANVLQEMSTLKVPILSIVIGEGGSGGALALGVGNEVWMLENAVYSVLTPESYASILWKDSSKAQQAAMQMKLEASDLYELGIIDKIIYEEEPVTRDNMEMVCRELENEMITFLMKYLKKTPAGVAKERYRKFRKY